MKKLVFTAAAAVLALGAAPALAHVTVQPPEAATGSFARFVVRVPNEEDAASTIKVEVQMPPELAEVSYQPKAGWTRSVNGKTVTWSGGKIGPGEFDEFGFSTKMPANAGTLSFAAIQTYDNGQVVSWTGPAGADKPAARVTVTQAPAGASGDDDDDHGATATTQAAASSSSEKADTEDGDEGGDARSWFALGLGAVAIALSLVSLTRGRRG